MQRLESKYAVRINFPRGDNEDGERDNTITVRGGKKGAEGAKKELLELMDYEKEHNQSSSVQVPGRALPRIFGRQGASIRELQEETGAEIDVNRKDPENPGSDATFVIRGTKTAIAQAKKAITAIISEIQDEVTYEIAIDRSMHSSIVGKGGQNSELRFHMWRSIRVLTAPNQFEISSLDAVGLAMPEPLPHWCAFHDKAKKVTLSLYAVQVT